MLYISKPICPIWLGSYFHEGYSWTRRPQKKKKWYLRFIQTYFYYIQSTISSAFIFNNLLYFINNVTYFYLLEITVLQCHRK